MLRRLLFASTLSVSSSLAFAAPVVWNVADGGNGHAYEVVAATNGITWDDARSAAMAAGGDLATITSAAENNFVFSLTDSDTYWWQFNSAQAIGPWLGAYWTGGSGPTTGWHWVTDEPFVYTNWAPGEPDHFSNEDRLEFADFTSHPRGNTWNDLQNAGGVLPHGYVIEYIPEPSAAALACTLPFLLIRRSFRVTGSTRASAG